MTYRTSSLQSLRRVFRHAFFAHDLAEPLLSFDEQTSAVEARTILEAKKYELVGVRTEGLVSGYALCESLGSGKLGKYVRPFEDSLVIPDSLPLAELVLRLNEIPRLFVSTFGRVGGIVTRADLEKPVVRMWLFGMITLIELRFNRLIERHFTGDEWTEYVSEGRVAKARELLAERARRQQGLALLDCLQLADKAQIVARCAPLRESTRFESRGQVEKAAKMVERLRNNLAHSQEILTTDWDTIILLSERLDAVLEGPGETASAARSKLG